MGHGIYEGYDIVITQEQDGRAWHYLDQPFVDKITWRQAYQKVAGWLPSKVRLKLPNGQDSEAFAIVRQDPTDANKLVHLGTVTDDYQIYDNEKLFQLAEPFLESDQCYITSAGSLNKGADIFCCMRIKNEYMLDANGGDSIRPFVLFRNSHGYKKSFRATISGIRTVCANTVSLAEQSDGISVPHVGNVEANIKAVVSLLSVANQKFMATVEQYEAMKKTDINQAELDKYVVRVLSSRAIISSMEDAIFEEQMQKDLTAEEVEEKRRELERTLFPKMKQQVLGNFETAPGCDGRSVLSALSAVTYWTTNQRGISIATRFRSTNFGGENNRTNRKAHTEAMQLVLAKR